MLIVDPDSKHRTTCRDAVHARWPRMTIDEAPCGVDALATLRRDPYDIVVSDHRLADTSGVTLLEQVGREHPGACRFLMSSALDLSLAVDAINRAQIHKILRRDAAVVELPHHVADVLARPIFGSASAPAMPRGSRPANAKDATDTKDST